MTLGLSIWHLIQPASSDTDYSETQLTQDMLMPAKAIKQPSSERKSVILDWKDRVNFPKALAVCPDTRNYLLFILQSSRECNFAAGKQG